MPGSVLNDIEVKPAGEHEHGMPCEASVEYLKERIRNDSPICGST